MDFDSEGLLDGLEGEEREARRALLEWLAEDGAEVDELREAVSEERLALLPVERVLGTCYSAREIESRTGVPAETLLRGRRLLGLPEATPDDRVFSDDQIAAAKARQRFIETGLSEEAINEITRVLGEAMARMAATTTAAFVEAFLKPGDTEEDVAKRFATAAEQLGPAIGPVLLAAYNAHLREGIRRGIISREERKAGRVAAAQDMTVAFADLVGFTRLSGELEADELGVVAGRLAEVAAELAQPPVRLVKTIGDAAMFVSPEAPPMIAVALSLVEAMEQVDVPALRAGLAHGPSLMRAGDFYGQAVNLASRVTGFARPGSVVCTQEVHDMAVDDFRWSFAGRHRFKGIDEPVAVHRARRLEPGENSTDGGSEAEESAADGAEKSKRRKGGRPRRRGSR